jgi:N-acetylglucosamine malate deacetylase 1
LSESRDEGWKKRFDQWFDYVQQTAAVLEAGRSIPCGPTEPPLEPPALPSPSEKPVKILIAAPHPDDESLIGALPLRWCLESAVQVVNCAITLGKNLKERQRRASELRSACRVLGFGLAILGEEGLNNVTLQNRLEHPEEWTAKVEALKEIFDREEPDVVLAPHAEDFHNTHIGTHYLVVDALGKHLLNSKQEPLPLIETEFWHELSAPNLMVEVPAEVVAIQIMATAEHGGEVSRNPYHLRLPARMMDNVRRGSEVVAGQGSPAQPFSFAELYRVTFMRGKEQVMPRPGGRMLGRDQKLDVAWLRSEFWLE